MKRSLWTTTAAWPATFAMLVLASAVRAGVPLADQPLFSTVAVPGNVALALSVEWPTASRAAHTTSYVSTSTYLGYFDPAKCYVYSYNSSTPGDSYFQPAGSATNHTCVGKWSGNFLNWATMQAIDPFRWALTGGYRVVDTTTTTILQKAWHSGQGSLFPNKAITGSTVVSGATPFSFATLNVRIQGLGFGMYITGTGDLSTSTPTQYSNQSSPVSTTVYAVTVRVKVCDPSGGAGGVESNCKQYGSNWKPEGLIQKYADKLRFAAFGYLNDDAMLRDGGVLRARMKYVGPTQPVPGSSPIVNSKAEWSSTTGVFATNPDPTDATQTSSTLGISISRSGVSNYLNMFGQIQTGNYKSYDPVSELYYTALRYYENLGNVPEYTNMSSATAAQKTKFADSFPVITEWDDPVLYSCQKNFILGIGDIYTHRDKNLPGSGTGTVDEPSKPSAVSADTTVNAVTATNKAFQLQGLSSPNWSDYSGRNNSAGIVGLAYYANTSDIRPDDSSKPQTIGKQTVQTYWVDVLEQPFVANNQFYLAAKYGGFKVPNNYDMYGNTTALPDDWWWTTGDMVGTQKRPDNYFTAGRPDTMVDGLTKAFASIVANLKAYTTSFATATPQLTASGNASFSSQYDSQTWTGELKAAELSLNAGSVVLSDRWKFSDKLAAQLAGTGWNTNRRVVTWNSSTSVGVPFRTSTISSAQQTALDTVYVGGNDSGNFLNYLRGDRTYELNAPGASASAVYRSRSSLVGDIVGSKLLVVGPPSQSLADTFNPGYSAFKSTWSSRAPVVYFGANDGMLHAVNGDLTNGGSEIFAYVPSALFDGPSGTPSSNGLAALGNPAFTHYYYVNSTPAAFDIDFNKTSGASGSPDWRTVLIGGLGKGGKSYYAIDVTNPGAMTSETNVAGKVLWEFSHPKMGYSFGQPLVVKTRQYGWVVIFTSGYNNADGIGYIFIVNPRTGQLLQPPIPTGAGSTANEAGLAHANAFLLDRTDGTTDAVYAGDLLGNLWRFDLTASSGNYPAPTKLAVLTDANGAVQPVTTRPTIGVQAGTLRRFVLVGTGRMLDTSDIGSTQGQAFYAILDGTEARFNPPTALPSGVSFPILRSNLANNSNLLTGVNQTQYYTVTQMGWYVELGTAASSLGWRVLLDPSVADGVVTFAASLPNGDACNPSGTSRLYALDLGQGISRLLDSSGARLPYITESGVITDNRSFVDTTSNKVKQVCAKDNGETCEPPTDPKQVVRKLRRLNWREVPVVQ